MKVQVHKTRKEWLEARLDGIGASDVPGILGMSRFASPWSIWQTKVDRVIDETPPSPEAEAGRRLEFVIGGWFQELCDVKWTLEWQGDFTMHWREDLPLFATPDRLLCTPIVNEREAVLELKCAWYDQAKRFRREFPIEYRTQIQVQMHCTGLKLGYFAVLLNGIELVWFREEYSEKFMVSVLRKCKQFWQYVKDRTPPPEDFSAATARAIAAHYQEPEEIEVELPDETSHYPEYRISLNLKIKGLERQKAAVDNRLRADLGNATAGTWPDGGRVTWKPNSKGHRTLRVTRRKDG